MIMMIIYSENWHDMFDERVLHRPLQLASDYIVSKKTVQNCFCQNFVKFPPILIIFGTKMAKRL